METASNNTQQSQGSDGNSKTMRAVVMESIGARLIVKDVPRPVPASGEVLIKVEAAPINPSDLESLEGNIFIPTLPFHPGFEGAGTVVDHGGGLIARFFVGRRVAFAVEAGKIGTWGQYVKVPALQCLPLNTNIDIDNASCSIVNPFTAVAFQEIVKQNKYKAVVIQAAASQLGRMLVKLFKNDGIKVLGIVRKNEQKELLEKLGCDLVFNSTEKDFEEKLRKNAEDLDAKCLFECVCGDITGKTIRALPKNSITYIYGHLDQGKWTQIDFGELLKNNKSIKPFMLPEFLEGKGILGKLGLVRRAQGMMLGELKSEVARTFKLDDINEALHYYKNNMTQGKIVIKPHFEA